MTGSDYFRVSVAPILCVAIAVFGSHVIHGISMEVAKARLMGSYQLVERIGQGGELLGEDVAGVAAIRWRELSDDTFEGHLVTKNKVRTQGLPELGVGVE